MFKDYYHILGVERLAKEEEIKEAYRKLAVLYHPDQNDDEEAHQLFIDINEAYHVLIDAEERRKYDHRYLAKIAPRKVTTVSSYEMTRAKRASRYARGRYAPRVRYRGTTYTGPTYNDLNKKGESTSTMSADIFSDHYKETIVSRKMGEVIGYRYYSLAVRWLVAGILVFCLAMLGDYHFSDVDDVEMVASHHKVAWSFSEPGVVRVATARSRFGVLRFQAEYLPIGSIINVEKTFYSHEPIKVSVDSNDGKRTFTTYGGLYDGANLLLIYLLTVMCLVTLIFRRNLDLNVYIGTVTLLVGTIFLGIILKVG